MTASRWAAPHARSPVDAAVSLPGSKSITNRALVLAALAPGPSRLVAPLRSRDTGLMVGALRALGARLDDDGADLVVTASVDRQATGELRIELGNAGTVARFVPAVCALTNATVVLDGDARIRERPVGPLVAALRALGARIDGDGAPLVVHGSGHLDGGAVRVDARQSSQFVSGLLLAGPLCDAGVQVRLEPPGMPSAPHVAMTVDMMRASGAVVDVAASGWTVAPGAYAARDVVVEPDLSGASAFLGAAAATAGRVTVRLWPALTTQPGAALPALLESMGCRATTGPEGLTVTGPERLEGIDADLRDAPELTPVLAVLAALAATPSRLVGVAHLRVQETDRLSALATEINRLGGDVDELPDGLVIRPAPLHGGAWRCYDDHRLAMAGAVLGLTVPDVELDDIATVGKTMPDFVQRWSAMLRGDA
jgi:3-phosphoshikimate 1-carboxyvinyltransferase